MRPLEFSIVANLSDLRIADIFAANEHIITRNSLATKSSRRVRGPDQQQRRLQRCR
ncbi:hypothetical protein RRSWK_05969 [Rhodopirellula sp. SWK7]|nr:hypothetical protein RRSWK_05969 [Rhodopirellula sp. SWK7]